MSAIRKVLVPIDGSPPSIAALEHAVTLASDCAAELEVLHVEAPDVFEVGSAVPLAPSARAEDDGTMAAALRAVEARIGSRMRRRTESGDPVRRILEVAREEGADLIVMGTHGRVGRMHMLLGSVAEAVLRNAPCPVLTVREPGGEYQSFAERIHEDVAPTLAEQIERAPLPHSR